MKTVRHVQRMDDDEDKTIEFVWLQLGTSGLFILISLAVFLAERKLERKPWSDCILLAASVEISIVILQIIAILNFDDRYEELLVPVFCLCSKLCLIKTQRRWRIHIFLYLLAQICLEFYLLVFKYFDISLVCFWISAVKLLCNGSLFILFLPLCFKKEALEKQEKEKKSDKFGYVHDSSNLFSKLTFSWILPMYLYGYKNQIDVEMLEKISDDEKSSDHHEWFKKHDQNLKDQLFKPCLQMNAYLVILGAIFRLLADVCSLACALSIKWIVKSVQQSYAGNVTNSTIQIQDVKIDELMISPYIVMCGILILGLLQGLFSQGTSHFSVLAGIRTKNALLLSVFEKILRTPSTKSQEGDASNVEHNLINLATEDVSNVKEAFWNLQYVWALPIKMAVIVALVYQKIGWPGCLGSISGIFIIIPLQLLVGKFMIGNNKEIQKFGDKRIFLASEAIQGMKSLKLNCLESWKSAQIKEMRDQELKHLNVDSWLWSIMTFVASISTLLLSSLIFGIYGLVEDQTLQTEDIFTTLALLNQLTVCLSVFPVTLPIMIKAMLSIKRLKSLFGQEDKAQEKEVIYKSNQSVNDINQPAISMLNATYTWSNSDIKVLENITTDIKKGSLTMIVSPDNAFFLSLLQEIDLESGSYNWNLSESIAYVGSSPWIIDGTIKENILMGRPWKEKRYKKVLFACDLHTDIDFLPLKDETEVGDDGVLLSGGQRQRIAIARCLYSKAECSILDLPFSALDSTLALHIFEHGIQKVLLKRKRTVIIRTHRKDLLKHACKILSFDADGHLNAQGTYADLRQSNLELFEEQKRIGESIDNKTAQERWKLLKNIARFGIQRPSKSRRPQKPLARTFKRFESSAHLGFCHNLITHSPITEEGPHERPKMTKPSKRPDLARFAIENDHKKKMDPRNPLHSQDSMIGFQFAHRFVARMTSNASQISGFSDDQDEDFDHDGLITHHDGSWDEESRETGSIKSTVIKAYFKAGGVPICILFLVISCAFQMVKISADFTLNNPEHSSVIETYLTLSAIAVVISAIGNVFGLQFGAKARKVMHQTLLENVFKTKPHLFEALSPGRFISRFSQDMLIIDQKLPPCFQRMTLVAFICVGALIVNAIQSPWFLVFAVPSLLVYWIIQHFYRRTAREIHRIESSTRSPCLDQLSNTYSNLITIRAFKEQRRVFNQFCDSVNANTTAELLVQSGARWLGVALDSVGSIIVFSSVLSCLLAFENAQDTLGLALNYSLQVPIYLAWVIKFMTDLESCFNSVERITEYSDLEKENVDEGLEHDIEDVEVVFDYVGLSHGDSHSQVVYGLNFKIPSMQKLAIVGRSGSGKSTIIDSLSRMSRVVKGTLLINGHRIEDYSLTTLRTMIKTVSQEIFYFGETVKEALDPLDKHEKNELEELLEKLKINLQLNSNVRSLTPSQKQELAIAQALVSHPKLLILDEATSTIEDEKSLMTNLLKLCKEKRITLISVVHRLSNIMDYDRVLVIGDGRLLEDGKPQNLLKKPMGFFSTLYRNSSST